MKSAAALGALAWSFFLAPFSPGAADPELDRLEHDYLAQRDVVVRPLLMGFAEKLRSLHSSLSQRHDPRAAAVKTELDRVVQRLSLPGDSDASLTGSRPAGTQASPGRVGGGLVELRGPKAVLTGEAVYDEKIVAAVQFKAKGAGAVWNLPPFKPGRYRVRIDCGCAAGFGAIARLVFGDQPPQPFTVLPTSETGQVTSFNLGEVDLLPATTTVKIEMVDAPSRTKGSGGFSLYVVSLTPAELVRTD